MRRKAIKLIIGGLALSALGGCGFQLRGKSEIPWHTLYVDAAQGNPAAHELVRVLRDRGVTLAENARQAEATIKIRAEKQTKTVLALSGGGRVREYRLNYELSYSMTAVDGTEIFAPSSIKGSRDFTYDDNQYLAKTAEEDLLYSNLRDDAVQQVVRRLASR